MDIKTLIRIQYTAIAIYLHPSLMLSDNRWLWVTNAEKLRSPSILGQLRTPYVQFLSPHIGKKDAQRTRTQLSLSVHEMRCCHPPVKPSLLYLLFKLPQFVTKAWQPLCTGNLSITDLELIGNADWQFVKHEKGFHSLFCIEHTTPFTIQKSSCHALHCPFLECCMFKHSAYMDVDWYVYIRCRAVLS